MKRLFFVLSFFIVFETSAQIVEKVMAVVNNEPILLSEFKTYKHNFVNKKILIDPTLLFIKSSRNFASNKKALLEHLINEKLLDQAVKKEGILVSEKQVTQHLKGIAQAQGAELSALTGSLQQEGISLKGFREHTKRFLGRSAFLRKKLYPKIQISKEDVKRKMRSQKKNLVYELSHITVSKSEDMEADKKKIETIYRRLQNSPEKFQDIAQEVSEAPDNIKLGTFSLSDLRPELRAVVASLKKNNISQILSLQNAFQIIKVDNRTVSTSKKSGQENQIRQEIGQELILEEIRKWIGEQRRSSFIRINS